jgi:hypothetical protein
VYGADILCIFCIGTVGLWPCMPEKENFELLNLNYAHCMISISMYGLQIPDISVVSLCGLFASHNDAILNKTAAFIIHVHESKVRNKRSVEVQDIGTYSITDNC